MPVFYAYEVQVDAGFRHYTPVIEADGKLLTGTFHHVNCRPADWLGVPSISEWCVEATGDASWGVAEFTPDDDGDNLLFWKVEAGKVLLRVQNRVIVLDVAHINQPDSPSGSGEGGEE
jgi:hypothetical protein